MTQESEATHVYAGPGAPSLREAAAGALDAFDNLIGSDCPGCTAEGSWREATSSKPARMVLLKHDDDCLVEALRSALAREAEREEAVRGLAEALTLALQHLDCDSRQCEREHHDMSLAMARAALSRARSAGLVE